MKITKTAKYRILAALLAVLLVLALLPSAVLATGETATKYIAFTSDVHGKTERLGDWLEKLGSPLECMMFSGDYPERGSGEGTAHLKAQQCAAVVNEVCGDIPVYLARGNHDSGGTYAEGHYHRGLVYNGEDYAVYAVEIDESNTNNQAFMNGDIDKTKNEIEDLSNALSEVGRSKPVFVISHFPIHYYSGRTTSNAKAMIDVLNNYGNAIFLWGHNHTMQDPYYGRIFKAGDELQYANSSSSKAAINFTYLSCGSMLDGNNGAYGLLAALTQNESGTQIDFMFKDLDGETKSPDSVFIPFVPGLIPISSVKVTGIDMPIAGANPDVNAVTAASSYTVTAIAWEPSDSPFADETVYTVNMTLTANSGYEFTTGTTATVNGAPANAALNTDGTLTVSYTFPKTGIAGVTTYEKVNTVIGGGRYVIVAQSEENYYALTANKITVDSTDYLSGAPVTISESGELSGAVDNSMIWTFTASEAGGNGFKVINGEFLIRESGTGGGIYVGEDKDDASYSDWIYDDPVTENDYMLYVYSSNQNRNLYLKTGTSGSSHYFRCSSNSGQTVYLYRVLDGGVPSDIPIGSAAVTGIETPIAGNTPDTTAAVGSGATYTVTAIAWEPSDSPFANETVYTVNMTLTANSGYGFTTGTTATVNGQSANAALNTDGTLTVSYTFPKTGIAGVTIYEKVNTVISGGRYVIVAQSEENYYALTANKITVDSTDYLSGAPVTISESGELSGAIDNSMIWTFTASEAGGNGFKVINGKSLIRESGTGGGIYVGDKDDPSYSDWIYGDPVTDNDYMLYVYSSNQNKNLYLKTGTKDSSVYFRCSSNSGQTVYLYRVLDGGAPSDIPIDKVSVTGIEAPLAGNTPDTAAVIPDDANYTVTDVTWFPAVEDGTFGYGTTYTVIVTLAADPGFAFTADVTAEVNNESAQAEPEDSVLTVSYTFSRTENEPIGSVAISIVPPKAGNTPDMSADTGSVTYSVDSVVWSPAVSGKFAGETVYTVTMTLSADEGYRFSEEEGVAATVNGRTANAGFIDGILTVTYEFPATGPIEDDETEDETAYVPAEDAEDGGQYLIVAKFGNLHYALTPVHTTENGTVNLIGVPVAVSGDKIIMNFVDSTMLWTFTREDTESGFTIANNGFYLNRTSKFPGVYISHFKAAEPYSAWMYDSGEKALFTYSVNRSCNIYLNLSMNFGSISFCSFSGDFTDIYLYKPAKPAVPVSVTAVFEQNGAVIYPNTAINSLKNKLTVTVTFSDGTEAQAGKDEYTISGTLAAGTSVMTVDYRGLCDTFNVAVTALPNWYFGDIGGNNGGDGGSNIDDEEVPKSGPSYLDVDEDAPYYEAVEFVTEKGLFNGVSFRIFAPDIPVSRAMFVTLLSRIEFNSSDAIPEFICPFTDLTQNWYRKPVAWGAHNRIILGVTDTLFFPDAIISREQAAALLYRYATLKGYDMSFDPDVLNSYDDMDDIASYAKTPMMWAVSNGLISGISETELAPKNGITRAELAVIAMEFYKYIGKA